MGEFRKGTADQTFAEWVEAKGFQRYVAMCASGTLGMNAPAVLALRDAYEREFVAGLVPPWWWEDRRLAE